MIDGAEACLAPRQPEAARATRIHAKAVLRRTPAQLPADALRVKLSAGRTVTAMPASRQNVASDSPYESIVGYSRAVRVGPLVAVAGTTGRGDDLATQTRDALSRIETALKQAGATLADVFRTRIFITDISHWREVGDAHAKVFGAIRPAATMVEVSALIAPELLVEIEADAYVGS